MVVDTIMSNKNLVIMFVKEPKLGFVKTRLAKSCGDKFTLNLYLLFVEDMIYTLQGSKSDFKLCANSNLELINKNFGHFDNFLQCEGDLGIKMQNAFEQKFAQGYEKIIIIGSDIPQITNKLISQSFTKLNTHDAVLGSSLDGGYYLIGFNKNTFYGRVFKDIKWSTKEVLKQTLQKLNDKNIYLLKELNDIDNIDDLKDLYANYKNNYFANSRTITFLRKSEYLWRNSTLSSSVEDQQV